jgi:hypothetical protein
MDDHPITNRSPLSPLFVCGGILLLVGDVSAEAEDSSPLSTEAEEVRVNEEFELLNEEETLSIATRYERPIPQAPSKVYFIIDEDIRHSGATVIPTVLRRVPDLSVMQVTGTDFHVSAGRDNQLSANKILMMGTAGRCTPTAREWRSGHLCREPPDAPAIVCGNEEHLPAICVIRSCRLGIHRAQ